MNGTTDAISWYVRWQVELPMFDLRCHIYTLGALQSTSFSSLPSFYSFFFNICFCAYWLSPPCFEKSFIAICKMKETSNKLFCTRSLTYCWINSKQLPVKFLCIMKLQYFNRSESSIFCTLQDSSQMIPESTMGFIWHWGWWSWVLFGVGDFGTAMWQRYDTLYLIFFVYLASCRLSADIF